VNKFTIKQANSTEFVNGETVSSIEIHVWDLPTVSTVHHPYSCAQGISLSVQRPGFKTVSLSWSQKRGVSTRM